MNSDDDFFRAMPDTVEREIVPQTRRGVKMGAKVFGAALLRRSDPGLVVASANHEASSPLWHGEVYAIAELSAICQKGEKVMALS